MFLPAVHSNLLDYLGITKAERFGSPYSWPLAFVALTVIGLVILPNTSEAKS